MINANQARRGGTLLDGVRLVRFDTGDRVRERIEADTAVHRGDHWLLINAVTTGNRHETRREQQQDERQRKVFHEIAWGKWSFGNGREL